MLVIKLKKNIFFQIGQKRYATEQILKEQYLHDHITIAAA